MDTRRKLKAKRKLACTVRSGRVEERFRALVEQENYYEAHQTMRVLYQRFLAQGKKDKALKLLRQAALLLLGKRQWESGTEVAVTFVRLLREQKEKVTKELLGYVEDLFGCYKFFKEEELVPHPHFPELKVCPRLPDLSKVDIAQLTSMQYNRELFIKAALKWTSVDEAYKRGHPMLHWLLAKAYFTEGELLKSRSHLLYANKPEALGIVLVEVASKKGYSSEADLFITQAVLQLLVLECKETGYETFQCYCKNHPLFSPELPPPFVKRPIMNFTWFILHTLDIGDVELYDFLCNCYTPVLNRDPSFFKYLEKTRSNYFSVVSSINNPHGSLRSAPSGIFDLLLGGMGASFDGGDSAGNSMTDLFSSLSNMLPNSIFDPEELPTVAQRMPHQPIPVATDTSEELD